MNLDEQIAALAQNLGKATLQSKHKIVTAESCTGGMLASAITDVAGSSQWFEMGFVTYETSTKTRYLDVDAKVIEEKGIVSEEVAQAMARGALAQFPQCTLSAGITGYAGPGVGSERMPVGSVCIGWGYRFNEHIVTVSRMVHVPGDRAMVRRFATATALQGLLELIKFGNPVTMPCEY